MTNRYEGGDLIVEALKGLGVGAIFSVSGGPLNSIYHACAVHDLPLVHTRHEAAACFMAEAMARVSGTPGVAAVTLGPGVSNTLTPALVSRMAGTPLLILGAQAGTRSFERGAGMSWDPLPYMTPVTKWAARVLHVDRIEEFIAIAWREMWAGRPGPVFLELPVDVVSAPAEAGRGVAYARPVAGLAADDGDRMRAALTGARRPLVILGDEVYWDPPANMAAVIEALHCPFVTLRLARGAIDEHHDLWAGPGYAPCNATLRRALAEADVILLAGHHFEFDLSFGDGVSAEATVVQIASDAGLMGKNRRADVAVQAAPSEAFRALDGIDGTSLDRGWVDGVIADWSAERQAQAGEDEDGVLHPVAAIDAVVEAAPESAIFASAHGNVDFWADARLRIRAPGRYLRAGQSGSLGAEIPYGVGARCADPAAPVVVFVGDGGVGFHVAELDTAARYDRPIVVVVLDDAKWGAIALPQSAAYGGEYEMDLPRRDWPRVAEGLGGTGYHAHTRDEIAAAIGAAISGGKPAIVQVPVRSVISPYMDFISG
jgi:acetolactate synthase-1/2/3 large subunit